MQKAFQLPSKCTEDSRDLADFVRERRVAGVREIAKFESEEQVIFGFARGTVCDVDEAF